MFRFVCVAIFVAYAGSLAAPLSAADPKAAAITDIRLVDADFAWQGEYLGSVLNDCGYCQTVGLQVVAMGKGEFIAVEYAGGLPGYGWPIGGERIKYQGRLDGLTLTLKSEGRQIAITGDQASFSRTGPNCWQAGSAAKVYRQSPTLGQCPPWGSIVLFDGTHTEHFKDGKIEDGLLKEGCETKVAYGDFQLHLEFRLPYQPTARGQGRANSGVYIQSRYEMQVLDSFGLDGIDNECGALYKQRAPDLNMCLPPLTWQTYDIWFRGPRFGSDGKKIENARITAWLNGVAVQNKVDVTAKTGGGAQEGTKPLVMKLQNHGNPIRFRNIWLVDHGHPTVCPAPLVVTQAAN